MNMLMRWLGDAKIINDAEKGVSYGEEAFNQIYEEALKLNADHRIELRAATVKGVLIGATGTGLLALGITGVNKLIKRNRKDEVKMPMRDLEKVLCKSVELDLSEVDETIKDAKKISKKNREALMNLITEISEHDKSIKH